MKKLIAVLLLSSTAYAGWIFNPFTGKPDATGSGGSSGANTTLSNLTSPTAINQDLLPATALSNVIGSTSLPWGPSFIGSASDSTPQLTLKPVTGGTGKDWGFYSRDNGRLVLDNPSSSVAPFTADVTGHVGFGTAPNGNGEMDVRPPGNTVAVQIFGTATLPQDLIDIFDGSNNPLAHVDKAGNFTMPLLQLTVQGNGTTPTCGSGQNGTLAITNAHLLCMCDGSSWFLATNHGTACTF